MHKIKVTFRKIDKEQEARLSKLVPKLLPLLPWWAKSLTIAIGGRDMPQGASMECITDRPYQRVRILINEGVIDCFTDQELLDDLDHEIAHCYNGETRDVIDNVLPLYVEEKDLDNLHRIFVRAVEFDNETLACQFRKRLPDALRDGLREAYNQGGIYSMREKISDLEKLLKSYYNE